MRKHIYRISILTGESLCNKNGLQEKTAEGSSNVNLVIGEGSLIIGQIIFQDNFVKNSVIFIELMGLLGRCLGTSSYLIWERNKPLWLKDQIAQIFCCRRLYYKNIHRYKHKLQINKYRA